MHEKCISIDRWALKSRPKFSVSCEQWGTTDGLAKAGCDGKQYAGTSLAIVNGAVRHLTAYHRTCSEDALPTATPLRPLSSEIISINCNGTTTGN